MHLQCCTEVYKTHCLAFKYTSQLVPWNLGSPQQRQHTCPLEFLVVQSVDFKKLQVHICIKKPPRPQYWWQRGIYTGDVNNNHNFCFHWAGRYLLPDQQPRSLVNVAAAQVIDVLAFSWHRRRLIVVQRVLLGFTDQYAGQIQEEFFHIVRFFGGCLQVEHALGLSKLLGSLSVHLPLFSQVNLVSCSGQQTIGHYKL